MWNICTLTNCTTFVVAVCVCVCARFLFVFCFRNCSDVWRRLVCARYSFDLETKFGLSALKTNNTECQPIYLRLSLFRKTYNPAAWEWIHVSPRCQILRICALYVCWLSRCSLSLPKFILLKSVDKMKWEKLFSSTSCPSFTFLTSSLSNIAIGNGNCEPYGASIWWAERERWREWEHETYFSAR